MTNWPAEWHPVNLKEAQEYLEAHQDGSGDPELVEECESFLSPQHKVLPGGGHSGGTHPSTFVQPDE